MTPVLIGIVADDLTGACDVAAATRDAGLATEVIVGVPEAGDVSDAECVVIALTTRSAPAASAVDESVRAAGWLTDQRARHLYQKYCSTFDSTDEGNIGPIADGLRRMLGTDGMAVGTPATPAVGRTQYLGHLFVHDRLLAESSMRDHPLTPMLDSDLVRVLGRQSDGRVALVRLDTLRRGVDATRSELRRLSSAGTAHVLLDTVDDTDVDAAAAAVDGWIGDRPLILGGGAGFAGALARAARARGTTESEKAVPGRMAPGRMPSRRMPIDAGDRIPIDRIPIEKGPRVILCGSASARTREQVAAFHGPVVHVDPMQLTRASAIAALIALTDEAIDTSPDSPVLITATSTADAVRDAQVALGVRAAAELVQTTFAMLATHLVGRRGARRLIVAGGETAGAVIHAIGARRLTPGALVAAGVPWMTASVVTEKGDESIALLLKSGNFGEVDLFTSAWEVAP